MQKNLTFMIRSKITKNPNSNLTPDNPTVS